VNTKFLLTFFAILLLSFQEPGYRLITGITAQASVITSDNLGNCYIVRNNVLSKYDPNGVLIKSYSDKSFGNISHVDVTDPMKPLLFYREFSKIVFLDNTLSLNGTAVSIEDRGFQDVQLAAQSRSNGLWIYIGQDAELVRLNEQLEVTHRTGNLRQVLGMSIGPDYLVEYNNRVYLNSPKDGILVFDMYGTYFKTIPAKQLHSFQVQDDEVLYLQDGKLHSYNIQTLAEQQIALPDSSALSFRAEKERLFLRKEKIVNFYEAKY
jgi:hypothetical protein